MEHERTEGLEGTWKGIESVTHQQPWGGPVPMDLSPTQLFLQVTWVSALALWAEEVVLWRPVGDSEGDFQLETSFY